MKSVFAVTERPDGKIAGVHATRESADVQAAFVTKELGREFGVVEWVIRKEK